MGNLLEVSELVVTYADGVQALRGVSLHVAASTRVGLIGPNGAGKTSLQLAIMGGVRFGGVIMLDGIDLSSRRAAEARSRCGMVFEEGDDQLFMPTLLDDVAFGPLNQGCSPAQAEAKARAAIAGVGLSGLEDRPAHHLSAGQKRNASLATVLSMDVKLLLLDEPTSGLDFRSRQRLIELLQTRPEAMLLATHDMDLVQRLCQEAVLLDAGRVVVQGPTGQVLSDTALLRQHGLA